MNFAMTILNQSKRQTKIMLHGYRELCCQLFTKNFFEDISNVIERWFDTSDYDENDKRPLPMGMN